jgi:hypothetical protein
MDFTDIFQVKDSYFSDLIWKRPKPLDLRKIIAKIADLGSKKAGLSFKENINLEEAFFQSLI